jgi:hypothetical protein
MKLSMSSCQSITKVLRTATGVSLLAFLFPFYTASAQPQEKPQAQKQSSTKAKAASTTPPKTGQMSPEEANRRQGWHKSMLLKPAPKKGCFTATYPETTWREVPCKPSKPHKPYPPHRGGISRLDTVGGAGPDFSATVTGHISQAEGSFDSVTGVTSTNAYSLQLNTDFFSTSACSGSPNPATCSGWEQFVYPSSGGGFIQYWLINYGPTGTLCPTPRHTSCGGFVYSDGWCEFALYGAVYCAIDGVNELGAPAEPMTSLGQLRVAGAAAGAGGAANDQMIVTVGGTPPFMATGDNHFPDMGSHWQEAEFNVFGDGGGSQAVFNSGANLQVRTEVISGTNLGPGCDLRSWTAESTNLTLVNSPPLMPAPLPAPALVFAQSNPAAAGAAATCADAVSIGDTHLHTFNGLFYDFQAAGDFVLAEVAPGFEVQTRQVSGAPTWPDATVNKAVAARFGKARVAICPAPMGSEASERVFVDAKPTPVADGQTLGLPEGGGITRHGNVYQMFGADGNSVRATVNAYNGTTWMDVNVGLGHWPSTAKGLIANVDGDVNQIATRDNFVLTNPFNFDELYHRFADSWRVEEKQSLLSVCNAGMTIERGIPTRPFYARDLEANVREKALGVCKAAGVMPGALLDACTLDVAVIGQDAAAKVYVGARAPIAIGIPVVKGSSFSWLCVILFLLSLAVIAVLLWLLLKRRKRAAP